MEYTINIKGRLMDLSTPQVMGILNVTPDSFYSGSRKQTEMEIAQRANQIIEIACQLFLPYFRFIFFISTTHK